MAIGRSGVTWVICNLIVPWKPAASSAAGLPSCRGCWEASYPATPPGTPAETPPGTPPDTPPGTPSGTPPGTPSGAPPGTPPGTPSGTPPGTPPDTPPGMPASTPVLGAPRV